jgi:hypothetical protein
MAMVLPMAKSDEMLFATPDISFTASFLLFLQQGAPVRSGCVYKSVELVKWVFLDLF